MMEGKCEDCYWYWGVPVGCHEAHTNYKDEEAGGCVWFEPKLEDAPDTSYEEYQKEWQ